MVNESAYRCFSCRTPVQLASGKVGRRDTCERCNADLHCCKNCRHYDLANYNECRESQAERVVTKDRANFCDFFSFAVSRASSNASEDPAAAARRKLDDLFKKQ